MKLVPITKSSEIVTHSSNNNDTCTILNLDADLCSILCLKFENDTNLTIGDFKIAMSKTVINVFIYEQIVLTSYLSLLMELNEIIHINDVSNNIFLVKFPNFLVNEVQQMRKISPVPDVKVVLIDSPNINYSLILQYTFLSNSSNLKKPTSDGQKLLLHNIVDISNNIYTFDVGKSNNIEFMINTKCTKGYFIECDVSKLTRIDIIIVNDSRMKQIYNLPDNVITIRQTYDLSIIKIFCKQITENLLYVPITISSYEDMSTDSYNGSMKDTSFDNLKVKCYSSVEMDVKLHSLSYMQLQYDVTKTPYCTIVTD